MLTGKNIKAWQRNPDMIKGKNKILPEHSRTDSEMYAILLRSLMCDFTYNRYWHDWKKGGGGESCEIQTLDSITTLSPYGTIAVWLLYKKYRDMLQKSCDIKFILPFPFPISLSLLSPNTLFKSIYLPTTFFPI